MLKETGRSAMVSPRVRKRDTTMAARRTEYVVEGAMEPAREPTIFDPSSRTPTSRPKTDIARAAANEREPEPLRLPIRKELLFQPKRKQRMAASPKRRLSIALRNQDQDHVAGVLGVVCYVVGDKDEVAQLDDCD